MLSFEFPAHPELYLLQLLVFVLKQEVITNMFFCCILGFTDLSRKPPGSWYPGPKLYHAAGASVLAGTHGSTRLEESMRDQKCDDEEPGGGDFITHKLTDATFDVDGKVHDYSDRLITDIGIQSAPASKRQIQVCFLLSAV